MFTGDENIYYPREKKNAATFLKKIRKEANRLAKARYFTSPTLGRLSLEQAMADIYGFLREDKEWEYKIFIGSDSQVTQKDICFVTVLVVHRLGKGAKFYYSKNIHHGRMDMKKRIWYEALNSMEVGSETLAMLNKYGLESSKLEIHVDIGLLGESKDLVREITGAIRASGFEAKIKPDSFAASTVANRFTKRASGGLAIKK